MNCEQAELMLIDSLMGELDDEAADDLTDHLAGCPRCSTEAAALETAWRDLGAVDRMRRVPDSERLTARFRHELDKLEKNRDRVRASRPSRLSWWASLGSVRPAWQGTFALALLGCGLLLGLGISSDRSTRAELEELRAELELVNRAVGVLLQGDSATERLQAVNWTTAEEPNEIVLDALLQSARLDPNVNVRLAAVDALARHADRGSVRSRLIDSLASERSPLVQLAVLEAVAGEQGFRPDEFERIVHSSRLDPAVLRHFSVQAESS